MLRHAYCYARGTYQGLRLEEEPFCFHPWPGISAEERAIAEAAARDAYRDVWAEEPLPALWYACRAGFWFLRGVWLGRHYRQSGDPQTEMDLDAYLDAQYFPAGTNIPLKYQTAACTGFAQVIGVPVRIEGDPGVLRFHLNPPPVST